MGGVTLLTLSTLVQALAAVLALRLMVLTGRRTVWLLLGGALLLMAVRRGLLLVDVLRGTVTADIGAESIALAISVLLLGGVLLMRPTVRRIVASVARLLRTEMRFQKIVETTRDWLWETDADLRLTYASPRCVELLGRAPEALTGRRLIDVLTSGGAHEGEAFLAELMERRRPLPYVLTVGLRENGQRVVLETSATPRLDATGAFTGFAGVSRDVTAREETRASLERVNRTIRVLATAREGLLRAESEQEVLDHVCRVAVDEGGYRMAWIGYGLDDPERTVRVNARYGDDTGYLDEIRVRWDDSELGNGPTGTAIRTERAVALQDVFSDPRYEVWRPAAAAAGYASSASLPLLSKGRLRGALNVYATEAGAFDEEEVALLAELAADVTHHVLALRDRAERQRLSAMLNHRQRLEALGEVTAGIAHDFNNLLAVILTNAELLRDNADEAGDDVSGILVDELLASARSGAALVKRMLSLSRGGSVDLRPIELADVVPPIVGTLKRLLSQDVEVTFRMDPDVRDAPIVGDPSAIEQILLNLATNARDAMSEGGSLRIVLSQVALAPEDAGTFGPLTPGPYVALTVEDTGQGMDAEVREHAFEPFFTTKGAGRGTGLGLSTTFALVRQHGGLIHVYSEPGYGSCFRIYFPLLPSAESARGEEAPVLVGGNETILVVDDEAPLRQAARRMLEHMGYAVLEARDGDHALDVLRRKDQDVHLVVSDLRMPNMDGVALYEAARNAGMGLPFLLTSGYSRYLEEERTSQPLSALDVAYLEKPWNMTDLLRTVRRVLDTSVV